ncbi:MAG: serine protein kinase PrkA, partial [Pseudomonadota bacterium]
MDNFVNTYLESLGEKSKESFKEGRHILSFDDYLTEAAGKPKLHLRDAAVYIRDMFDHYGTREVQYPWAKKTRFKLFDQPFGNDRDALAGQEESQETFYNLLQSFVREGRPHRFIILHGPNGSSKSTFVNCIARALEHYSSTGEGAMYRFNWIFPSEGLQASGLGFLKGDKDRSSSAGSFALLDESDIDSKLPCELKDHPLLLLPQAQREQFITEILGKDCGAA